MKTTREEANENIHENLVDNLQALLEKNYDAEKGFTTAMKDAKNERLKAFLKQQATQHARFATELDREIRNMNEKPIESGSTTGALHRGWIDIKSTFSANDDEAVLEECLRGEKASLKEYEEKITENRFPTNIASVLNNQLSEIRTTVSQVKKLEDLAENRG
jgi:uncharacterized protein (TIGR02284 family)